MPHLAYRDSNGSPSFLDLKEKDITIGRESDCDVILTSRTVSRHHARLRFDGARWHINDLGSLHGTFLNRVRVKEESLLSTGDQIGIGEDVVAFGAGPAPLPGEATPSLGVAIRPSSSGRGSDIPPAEEITADVVRDRLRGCPDQGTLCRMAVELAMQSTGANRGVLALRKKGERDFYHSIELIGASRLPPAHEIAISRTFVERLVKERIALIARDTDQDVMLSNANSIVKVDIRSILGAPLLQGDALLGYLYVDTLGDGGRFRGRIFRKVDLELVGGVAAALAGELTRRQL